MNESSPEPETITRLLDAVYPSFALLAGMELDLFTSLRDSPLTAKQLANQLGVQTTKLRPLLYALVVAGLLIVEDDLFSNTPESDHYLVRGQPTYLGGRQQLTKGNWRRVLRTAETIRAGAPQENVDYHQPSQAEMVAFFRGLYPGAVADAYALMAHVDFSTYDTLLDVGGGSGALAITIAQANPQLKATVLELHSITSITQNFIDEANIADRVAVLAGDAVHDSLPGLYDCVVLRHVIQVLSEHENRALLKNLATVLKPGGTIYLIGWMLDNSRLSPQNIVGYNLVLLSAYKDGQAYTEEELHAWLVEAGYVGFERVVMANGASIVKSTVNSK
ncbi:methyltransferase [Candidatus Leptofilum sp.]|uniref:methyltransferase n=1 Tax=Candidatus Leptofilum sp. TaxID=3241576 RepID=UPI003B5BEF78